MKTYRIATALGIAAAAVTAAAAFGSPGGASNAGNGNANSGALVKAARGQGAQAGRAGRGGRFGRLGRGIVTGEFKVARPDGTFATVRVNQGTVTAVDAAAKTLTLKRKDGQSVTVTATDTTKIGKDRAKATLADIKAGDLVRVMQADTGSGFTTKSIRAQTPPTDGGGATSGGSTAVAGDDLFAI
jgi:Cu/Ag efflux protein CusF